MSRFAWFAFPLLAACGGESGADAPSWDEAGPIIEKNCAGCHNPDGAAPFSLTTYAEAAPWSEAIGEAVANRTMPPWLVTSDGSCGDFRDSLWMDDADVETLVAWAQADAPEGKENRDLVPPTPRALERIDAELITPEIVPEREETLFAEYDEYRCFVMDNPAGEDIYITGYDVLPGNKAIVHHVLGMPLDPDATSRAGTTNGEELALMDGADGRPGWDCLGTAGGNLRERGIPITWAPGQGAVSFPNDMGVLLKANEKMVVQLHYNLFDYEILGESDSTNLRLKYESSVTQVAHVAVPDPFIEGLFLGSGIESLEPGQSVVEYTWELSGRDILWRTQSLDANEVETFKLWGVLPHMPQRGRKMDFKIKREDGPNECGAEVAAWSFDWQLVYFYEEPIEVSVDDVFKVTCTYDTSLDTEPVLPGWGTQYEMCLLGVVVTVD